MFAKFTILDSIKNQDQNVLREQFALDILMGFSESKKLISSKYFYDDRGSELFTKITQSKDYYPTDCEREIFENSGDEICDLFKGKDFHLVELGAGDGQKTKILLKKLLDRKLSFEYIPVDISEAAITGLTKKFKQEFPTLKQYGVVGEYMESLKWLEKNREGPVCVFFLGSNIGNFSKSQATVFLRTLWKLLNHDDLVLIGFDLKKDIEVLLRAYNDSDGYTQEFNLNLLERINRELGANFDLTKFQHFATYSPSKGAMESFLISLVDQKVYIEGLEREFFFGAYKPIHTEYSYKYLLNEVIGMAEDTGYKVIENFFDKKAYFVDSVWQVNKKKF